jgi:hypothetical protein
MFRSTSKRATDKDAPPEQSLRGFFDLIKPLIWDAVEASYGQEMDKFAEERVLKRLGYTDPASEQLPGKFLLEIMWEKSTREFQEE